MPGANALQNNFLGTPMVDPGASGTIAVDRSPAYVPLDSATAEARTLAAPTRAGALATLAMRTDGGDITLTVTGGYNESGDTTFTFSDPGQFIGFVSVESAAGTFLWRKFADYFGGNLGGLTASAADLNNLDVQALAGTPLAGFTGGTGTVFLQSRLKIGDITKTTIFFDLTGLGSSTTDLDIIGQGAAAAAYLIKLTAAEVGTTIDSVLMTCLEAPATGVTDIDLYSATEGTGKFDDAVTGLTETALITSGGAWTNGRQLGCTTVPLSTEYIYVCNGAGGTVGTYTAGKFLVEIYGHG